MAKEVDISNNAIITEEWDFQKLFTSANENLEQACNDIGEKE